MGGGGGGGVERTWIKVFKGLKKFSGWWWWWSPSENSVCPRPLLQFLQFLQFVQVLQFLQFRSVRLRQFTLEGRDVELDNILYKVTLLSLFF